MNSWPALDRFLQTDPRDVGCAEAMEVLHAYVDLVASGAPAEQRYPGIAAHLRADGPCGEDFEALLAAARPYPPGRRGPTAGVKPRSVRHENR